MNRLALILIVASACSSKQQDTPEIAAKKTQCRALLAHVYRISPQSALTFAGLTDVDADKAALRMVATLPPEDIDECVAAEPEVVECMITARDVVAVKACVPPDDVLACMHKAKDQPAIRATCAANPHAADTLP